MKENIAGHREAESTQDLSLRGLVLPLFRRKRAILITFLSVFALVFLAQWLSGPTYKSQMEILVNRERLDPLVSTEATTQTTTAITPVMPEEVNSEMELLTSRDVLEKVAIQNGMDQPTPGFSLGKLLHPHQTEQDRLARTVKILAKKIKAEVTTKTNLIQVSFSSGSPQLSYGVLNSLAEAYAAKHAAVHRTAGSYDFFSQETDTYRKKLADAEDKLKHFSDTTGVAAPDIQRTNLALQLANSIGLQHLAEQNIAADEQRIQSDRDQVRTVPARSPTVQTSAAADSLLSSLYASELAAETKRTQLALKYDPTWPLVKEADEEIAQTKKAIAQAEAEHYSTQSTDRDLTYEALRGDLAKSQADLASGKATLAATERSVQSLKNQMVSLDKDAILQNDLLREQKEDEANYLLYLGKREQERTTDALNNTGIANVVIAVLPNIPVLPVVSFPLSVVIAFALALFLSIGLGYTLDYLDSTLHSSAEVIEFLNIPVVISVAKKTA